MPFNFETWEQEADPPREVGSLTPETHHRRVITASTLGAERAARKREKRSHPSIEGLLRRDRLDFSDLVKSLFPPRARLGEDDYWGVPHFDAARGGSIRHSNLAHLIKEKTVPEKWCVVTEANRRARSDLGWRSLQMTFDGLVPRQPQTVQVLNSQEQECHKNFWDYVGRNFDPMLVETAVFFPVGEDGSLIRRVDAVVYSGGTLWVVDFKFGKKFEGDRLDFELTHLTMTNAMIRGIVRTGYEEAVYDSYKPWLAGCFGGKTLIVDKLKCAFVYPDGIVDWSTINGDVETKKKVYERWKEAINNRLLELFREGAFKKVPKAAR